VRAKLGGEAGWNSTWEQVKTKITPNEILANVAGPQRPVHALQGRYLPYILLWVLANHFDNLRNIITLPPIALILNPPQRIIDAT
jgi:hypothetical protein